MIDLNVECVLYLHFCNDFEMANTIFLFTPIVSVYTGGGLWNSCGNKQDKMFGEKFAELYFLISSS